MIRFHTNLDEAQPYVWELSQNWTGPIPHVGDEILFKFTHGRSVFFLRVVGVRWADAGTTADVELHMPTGPHRTIAEWCDWFKRQDRK